MKKTLCYFLCMVLLCGIASQAIATESKTLEDLLATSQVKAVKPIAYTHDFDAYSNVVGVLNSDGTKTAYLFACAQQTEEIDSLTGLVSTAEEKLQRKNAAQTRGISRPTIVETAVYSAKPDRNCQNEATMIIGKSNSYGIGRVYMKFDLSSFEATGIPYADILSACLHFTESTVIENDVKSVVEAYLVADDWEVGTITWETMPDYYGYENIGRSNVGSFDDLANPITTNQIYITKAVMAWLQGMDNNGILLKEKDDEYDNRFYTSDWAIANKKPYITVTYANDSAYTLGQGIENNTKYYIVNKETGKYLTANANGSNVTLEEIRNDYENTQQWKFTETSSTANYKITLANTGKCLKNSATTLNNPVVLGTTATTTAQTWRLFRNWNGTYRFHSKVSSFGAIKEGTSLYDVVQDEYTCDFEHCDEWTLIPVSKGTASFFDFYITEKYHMDSRYGIDIMKNYATQIAGYSSIYGETNETAEEGYTALCDSSLFYFAGHGEPGKLNFFSQSSASQGHIVVSNSLIEETQQDRSLQDLFDSRLNGLQLAVLSCCLSGSDPLNSSGSTRGDNMAGRLYWLGAHNVVSHLQKTDDEYSVAWDSAFMSEILLGRSLRTAKLRADNHIYDDYYMELTDREFSPYGNINERHDFGDESYIPGFSVESVEDALKLRAYEYKKFPQLTFSTSVQNYTNVVQSQNTGSTVLKIFTLPKDAIVENSALCAGNTFDVYTDEFGGIYWYYHEKNVLHSYEPYVEDLKIGNGVVDSQKAMNLANEFLNETGYNVNGYRVKTSNEFSKNYTIEFSAPSGRKKLVFHMQAEEGQNNQPGDVRIISFSAYVENYDS